MYKLASEIGGKHVGFKKRRMRVARPVDPRPMWLGSQQKPGEEGGCCATLECFLTAEAEYDCTGQLGPEVDAEETGTDPDWSPENCWRQLKKKE